MTQFVSVTKTKTLSDDIEVDVAFDTNDEVSLNWNNSSAITNVTESPMQSLTIGAVSWDGKPQRQRWGAFLTETNTAYESDFSAGVDGWSDNNGFATLTGNQDGIGGRDDLLKVDNTAGVARQIRPSNNTAIPHDGTFRLTLDVYRVGGTGVPAYMGAYSGNAGATQNPSVSTEMTENEWVTLDFGNLTYENYTRFNLFFSASPNSTVISGVADGGTIYFRNAQVTTSSNNATVHTWYDQAGSNDATQGTAANQPKIAEGGSLSVDDASKPQILFGTNPTFLSFTQLAFTNETIFVKSSNVLSNAFSTVISGADNRAVISQTTSEFLSNIMLQLAVLRLYRQLI